ncbi:MAG: GGDEF domain-containing protein [Nitrospiraceae bacterium]|nr:MAG: GGDEF domain-containing protein [Nitrospiraceae bacterium]
MITVLNIDINNFKQVNDTLGHSTGDFLLQTIAQTIKSNVCSIDIISRLGGDEFALLLSETDSGQAKMAMSKIQQYLMNLAKQNKWPITFSIGVITYYGSCELEKMIKEADNLMFSVFLQQHIAAGLYNRQRSFKLVRGVSYKAFFSIERPLKPVEHRIE